MASLYKERSKCLAKLPTMQYTVTDTGKEEGGWRKKGVTQNGESVGLKSRVTDKELQGGAGTDGEDSLNRKCRIT